jgi:hypothetical protein
LNSESTRTIGKKVSLYEQTSYSQNKNVSTRKVEVLTGGLREKNDLGDAKKKTGVLPGKISIAEKPKPGIFTEDRTRDQVVEIKSGSPEIIEKNEQPIELSFGPMVRESSVTVITKPIFDIEIPSSFQSNSDRNSNFGKEQPYKPLTPDNLSPRPILKNHSSRGSSSKRVSFDDVSGNSARKILKIPKIIQMDTPSRSSTTPDAPSHQTPPRRP